MRGTEYSSPVWGGPPGPQGDPLVALPDVSARSDQADQGSACGPGGPPYRRCV